MHIGLLLRFLQDTKHVLIHFLFLREGRAELSRGLAVSTQIVLQELLRSRLRVRGTVVAVQVDFIAADVEGKQLVDDRQVQRTREGWHLHLRSHDLRGNDLDNQSECDTEERRDNLTDIRAETPLLDLGTFVEERPHGGTPVDIGDGPLIIGRAHAAIRVIAFLVIVHALLYQHDQNIIKYYPWHQIGYFQGKFNLI